MKWIFSKLYTKKCLKDDQKMLSLQLSVDFFFESCAWTIIPFSKDVFTYGSHTARIIFYGHLFNYMYGALRCFWFSYRGIRIFALVITYGDS